MLADIYVSQGDVAKARDRLEDAIRFSPQNQGARQRFMSLQGR